jgi:hypothetical protein
MRPFVLLRLVLLTLILSSPGAAEAQTLAVHAAAGPTLVDAGYSFAAGVSYSPTSRLTLLFQYDHTHINSRTTGDGREASRTSAAGRCIWGPRSCG